MNLIPENLISQIQSLKQIKASSIHSILENYPDIITYINKLQLSDYDFGNIIKYNLEIKEYKCKICGSHVHFNSRLKNFPKYCSSDCVRKDKLTTEKRKATMLIRYNTLATMNIPDIRKKINNTNKKRYGNSIYVKTENFKNKRINSNSLKVYNKLRDTLTYANICDKAKSKNIIPLFSESEYKGSKKYSIKYQWKCNICNTIFQSYYANGIIPICPNCSAKIKSQKELDLFNYIKNKLPKLNIQHNIKSIIPPLELDIYIPELKLAIEFNGNYWHSSELKDKYYHINKTNLCKEKGIRLIHIFEWEWDNKKDQILKRIDNAIGIYHKRIYARQCIIKEIKDNNIVKEFLNTHHLQGYINSSINLGLYYKEELVAVMTFGKPRFNKKYEYELLRFATKYHIIGGASKLFTYFKKHFSFTSIISYQNLNWGYGNLYSILNFKLIDISKPNYIWFNSDIVYTRYQCQKYKLKNILKDKFNIELSENENMKNNGFVKIHDCGNAVWEIKID